MAALEWHPQGAGAGSLRRVPMGITTFVSRRIPDDLPTAAAQAPWPEDQIITFAAIDFPSNILAAVPLPDRESSGPEAPIMPGDRPVPIDPPAFCMALHCPEPWCRIAVIDHPPGADL